MKKQAYLLAAALIIAPAVAYGMVQPVAQPTAAPSARMIPTWQEPTAPGKIGKAWNFFRSFAYPVQSERYNQIKTDSLTADELFKQVKKSVEVQDKLHTGLKSPRRLAITWSAMGLGSLAYIWQYCMPIMNRVNGLKAAAAVVGGLIIAPKVLLCANNWWNNHYVQGFAARMKKSGAVTQDLAEQVKVRFDKEKDKAKLEAMLTSMVAAH